jgi:hypothetical protein
MMLPKKSTPAAKALDLVSSLPAMPSPRRRGATGFPSTTLEPNPHTPENSDEEKSARRVPPVVVFSPVKSHQCKKDNKLKYLPDLEAWDYDNSKIISKFIV